MTTIALPRTGLAVSVRSVEVASLVIGIVGFVLGFAGSTWDVSWHRAYGRDTFWSPPHVLMYVGTSFVGLSSLVAVAAVMLGRVPIARVLAIGPFRVERCLAAVGLGALTIISAAPIDDLWHRSFGRDVDIWSPPHLVAVVGAIVAYAGLAAAVSLGFASLAARARQVLIAALLGGLAGTFVFGMNFYYIFAWSREALVYPAIVAATIPGTLALGVALLRHRFAATSVALAYTALSALAYAVLSVLDWPPPAFASLVVVGALAVDLVRARTGSTVAIATAFVVAFVAVEGARMILTAPLPTAAVLTDRTVGHLATQYWAMASARPWLSAWPLIAIVLGMPLAALSWRAGHAVARVLTARAS